MSGNSSPPHQPNILRTPDKKARDFRATSQAQSNAGTYDERGGGRQKKIIIAIAAILIIAFAITIVVDTVAGRNLI